MNKICLQATHARNAFKMLCANKRGAIYMTDLIKTPSKLSVVHELRIANNIIKNNCKLIHFSGLVAAI